VHAISLIPTVAVAFDIVLYPGKLSLKREALGRFRRITHHESRTKLLGWKTNRGAGAPYLV